MWSDFNQRPRVWMISNIQLMVTFLLGQKKICVYGPPTDPNFLAPTLNIFMALSVQNQLNTLFLLSNVVFDV